MTRTRQTRLFGSEAPASNGPVELVGTVSRITYRSDETGYTVLRVSPEGEERTVVVVGKTPPVAVGERIVARGQWKDHPKFGRQLAADSLQRRKPHTEDAIVRYLGSGLAAGIGPKLAERIVETFGAETLSVIDSRPEELVRVPGISAAKARSLIAAVRENEQLRELTLVLEEHGLGARYASRLHDKYGESALNVVKEDPYRLVRDIWGIGFVRADALARSLGVEPEDPARVEAGLVHALRRSSELGHIYVPTEELVRATCELLGVDIRVVEEGIEEVLESRRAVREQDRIYATGLHRAEVGAAEMLQELLAADQEFEPLSFAESEVRRLETEHGVELDPHQVAALRVAHERSVLVVTGGPGTGKTLLTRFLLDLFDAHRLSVVLAAPTGRAARRLAETSGREAGTLHRLLGFDPQTSDFGRDESNPLEASVVLVDEASMVDQRLFHSLLRAIEPGTRLVLVGDADQLPSVGPGEVLRDLIRSGEIPTARLQRVFRQGERSGIVSNAHRVLAGERPETADVGEGDFVFVEKDHPEEIAAEIRRLLREELPRRHGVDSVRDVQVLVPMYKGEAGADALNVALQEDLNPRGREVRSGRRRFREGDRVIQLRNDYGRNIFNGEIGWVDGIGEGAGALSVRFDRVVDLPASDWDQVALAYAITVHKSQGSEYEWVVLPLTTQHAILLERPLFYTAITRARRGVILVGSRRALSLALRAGRARARRTTLAERLRGEAESAVVPDEDVF